MTAYETISYYAHQVEWYKGQVEFDTNSIKFYGDQLKLSRKEDREFSEWVMENPNYTEAEKLMFKDFVSKETKFNERTRRQYYERRKRDQKMLEYYETELAKLA